MPKLLSARELQEILHCGKERAYNLMHSESFPSMKLGHRWYVSEENFEKWINQYAYKTYNI